MKVLEIGCGLTPQARDLWPECELTTLDIDPQCEATITADGRKLPEELYEVFEQVFASHVLQCIPWWQTLETLKEWAKALRPGGGLYVVTPALEWMCEQVLEDAPIKVMEIALYGTMNTPFNVSHAGFNMRALRTHMELAGLQVVKARTGPYRIEVEGKIYEAQQHYVCGIKPGGVEQLSTVNLLDAAGRAPEKQGKNHRHGR
jgi:predicted SAM-dependent methyltransferase